VIFVDASFGEPPPKLGSGATAEGLTSRAFHRTRCLTDNRDAIPNGARDDRTRPLEISSVDAFGARTNARMKPFEEALAFAC
jgi:hypothetical protein